ncbi:hypothetical protein KEJ27_02400 [Candidatus Bathyarchaeota archaeon]|nr:hypothetical protein [Candidatus Bathyarchaeota archaeon]
MGCFLLISEGTGLISGISSGLVAKPLEATGLCGEKCFRRWMDQFMPRKTGLAAYNGFSKELENILF